MSSRVDGHTALAVQGPFSGQFAWVGENLLAAAQLALADAARDGWLTDAIELRRVDTGAAAASAPAAARAVARAADVVGVVGPAFSGEADRSGAELDAAGLAFVLPIATMPELAEHGWRGFFRLVATDAIRAPLTGRWMVERLGVRRAGVVSDGPANALAERLADALSAAGASVVHREQVERGAANVEAVARRLQLADVDGVYFAGEYLEAGGLRAALGGRASRSVPSFVADDGALTPEFVETAGSDAAEGAYATFPGADPATAPDAFAKRFRALVGSDPRAFAVEGHQATTLLLRAIAQAGADRAAVAAFVRAFDGELSGRRVAFAEDGESVAQTIYAYRVVDGAWRQQLELTANGRGVAP